MQESIKESLQQQLQGVEKRRHDLMPWHQKAQKRSQKIQSLQDKRRNLQNDKIDKNKMLDAEMVAELQSLQAGEERRGSDASQTVNGCWKALWQQLIALGANGIEPLNKSPTEKWEQHKGRCQEEKKDEGIVKMNKSKAEPISSWLPTPGGINQGPPAKSLELDLPRVRGVSGEDGSAGRSGTQGDRKRGPSRSLGRIPRMRKRMTMWEEWCFKQKREKNSQEKDPKTCEENSQGRETSTPERNSQGKDPRTLEENIKGGGRWLLPPHPPTSQINS